MHSHIRLQYPFPFSGLNELLRPRSRRRMLYASFRCRGLTLECGLWFPISTVVFFGRSSGVPFSALLGKTTCLQGLLSRVLSLKLGTGGFLLSTMLQYLLLSSLVRDVFLSSCNPAGLIGVLAGLHFSMPCATGSLSINVFSALSPYVVVSSQVLFPKTELGYPVLSRQSVFEHFFALVDIIRIFSKYQ